MTATPAFQQNRLSLPGRLRPLRARPSAALRWRPTCCRTTSSRSGSCKAKEAVGRRRGGAADARHGDASYSQPRVRATARSMSRATGRGRSVNARQLVDSTQRVQHGFKSGNDAVISKIQEHPHDRREPGEQRGRPAAVAGTVERNSSRAIPQDSRPEAERRGDQADDIERTRGSPYHVVRLPVLRRICPSLVRHGVSDALARRPRNSAPRKRPESPQRSPRMATRSRRLALRTRPQPMRSLPTRPLPRPPRPRTSSEVVSTPAAATPARAAQRSPADQAARVGSIQLDRPPLPQRP